MKPAAKARNGLIAAGLAGVVVVMTGAAFAAVPLYRMFCQVTGFDGTTQRASAAAGEVIEARDLIARAVPTVATGIGHALFSSIWPSNPWSRAYRDEADMTAQRPAGWLSGSCLLVRWEAFDAIGGFDERYFMYLEDVDLGDRFTRAGSQNIFCPDAVISHAKGHSTQAHAGAMLRAHHSSAYRFQADRHPAWWQAPLRAALWLGLQARGAVTAARASTAKDSEA